MYVEKKKRNVGGRRDILTFRQLLFILRLPFRKDEFLFLARRG